MMNKININDRVASCKVCGSNLFDISKIRYEGQTIQTERFTEELYSCRCCNTKFVIRYDLFRKDGHINHQIFTGDINNPEYQWQDNLVEGQKKVIADHLRSCSLCTEKLAEEELIDAWLGSLVHGIKS